MSELYDTCLEVYEASGQSGVLDFVRTSHPEVLWAWCDPCEFESPIDSDNSCLVCGSELPEDSSSLISLQRLMLGD